MTPAELKAWRTRKGWTQAQAAEFLRVSKRTYEGWEVGRWKAELPGPVQKLIEQSVKSRKEVQ